MAKKSKKEEAAIASMPLCLRGPNEKEAQMAIDFLIQLSGPQAILEVLAMGHIVRKHTLQSPREVVCEMVNQAEAAVQLAYTQSLARAAKEEWIVAAPEKENPAPLRGRGKGVTPAPADAN